MKQGKVVRVIRDTRDASKDYFISENEAKQKYNMGELAIDLTNSHGTTVYIEVKRGDGK